MSDLRLNLDEFENVLIYKCLTDSHYYGQIAGHLNSEYIKDKNIKYIYDIINTFYNKNKTTPNITELKTFINGDEAKDRFKTVLKTVAAIDKNYNTKTLLESTERYIKERAIYATLLKVAEEVSEGKIDTSFILDQFEKSCNFCLQTDTGIEIHKDINAIIADIKQDQPTIATKWTWVDKKLDGGFLKNGRAMYIFAGETNVGKSIFLGNIACNIAEQGKTVLLISLEMSEMMYARRLSSKITQIPMKELRSSVLTLEQKIQEIQQTSPSNRVFIKEFPPSTVTVSQIDGFINQITSLGIKPDAIIIDYLNLLRGPANINSYERVKFIAEQARALSYTYNCPVISATQINRTGYNVDNPGLETISESIGLAATADVIFTISQDDEDRELNIVKIAIPKNRFGSNHGGTTLKIDYSTLTITDDDSVVDTGEQSTSLHTLENLS